MGVLMLKTCLNIEVILAGGTERQMILYVTWLSGFQQELEWRLGWEFSVGGMGLGVSLGGEGGENFRGLQKALGGVNRLWRRAGGAVLSLPKGGRASGQ